MYVLLIVMISAPFVVFGTCQSGGTILLKVFKHGASELKREQGKNSEWVAH